MGALLDQVGNKTPGELIRSDDWNALVKAVDDLQAQVTTLATETNTRFDAVEAEIQTLTQQTAQVQSNLDAFRTAMAPATFRTSLQADRGAYAMGEIAELTATVATLTGDPVSTGDADRPWVEFVATWGQLRAADGFETIGGEGDRTMSVHADATGVAKVLMVADHLEGFSSDLQDVVAQTLTTRLAASNVTVAQSFMTAATPKEAKDAGAMSIMADEYDSQDASSVRSFIDAYHLREAGAGTAGLSTTLTPGFRDFQTIWRDHRATVMAVTKADQDATTPDENRGVGAVTLTFRDWIRPWITLEYFSDERVAAGAETFRTNLAQKIGASYADSIGSLQAEVTQLTGSGVLGRQRAYAQMHRALDGVTPATNVSIPYDLLTLTKPLQDGLVMQQTLESVQTAAPLVSREPVAFTALSNAASRSDVAVADVRDSTAALGQRVDAAQQAADAAQVSIGTLKDETFTPLQTQVAELSGKFDGVLSDTGTIGQLGQRLQTVETHTNALQAIDPSKVNDAIGKISGLQLALDAITPPNG